MGTRIRIDCVMYVSHYKCLSYSNSYSEYDNSISMCCDVIKCNLYVM